VGRCSATQISICLTHPPTTIHACLVQSDQGKANVLPATEAAASRWGPVVGWCRSGSASARLPPGGVVEDVDVHAVLREQHVPHHRAPDEAVPHWQLQKENDSTVNSMFSANNSLSLPTAWLVKKCNGCDASNSLLRKGCSTVVKEPKHYSAFTKQTTKKRDIIR